MSAAPVPDWAQLTTSQRIRVLMAYRMVSAKGLGKTAGLAPSTISNVALGRTRMTLDTAQRIAGALDVPLNALVNGSAS